MASITIGPTGSERAEQTVELFDRDMWIPDDDQADHPQYENVKHGDCMYCGRPLSEDTILLVGSPGILGVWCKPECVSDSTVLHFLSQVREAIVGRDDDSSAVE